MTIKVGSQDVQAIYVGSTPVQEVYVGSTLVWPAVSTWYKWLSSQIPNYYIYTSVRNPSVGSSTFEKSGTVYNDRREGVGHVDVDSSNNVTTIWTEWDSTIQTGYSWSYAGVDA